MAKKVQYKDIADENLFGPGIESGKAFLKVLDDIEKEFKDVLKASKKAAESFDFNAPTASGLKDLENGLKQAKQATQGLSDVEKEREKLLLRLNAEIEKAGSVNSLLTEQIKEQRKANREQAKEELGLIDTYGKTSKRLTELRRRYKSLVLEVGENTKEARELKKEVVDLDKTLKDLDKSVGQSQRNVGNYETALDGLNDEFGKLKNTVAAGVLFQALTALAGVFQKNDDASASFQKALATVTVSIQLFVNNIVAAFQASDGFLDFFPKLRKEFEGFGEDVKAAIEAQKEFIDVNLETERSIAKQSQAVEKLRVAEAELRNQSEDNTISLKEQLEATEGLAVVSQDIAEKELQIAADRLRVAQQQRDASAAANKDRKASVASEQALAEAQAQFAAAQVEQLNVVAENARRRREILRDQAELDLDILIDAVDAQKTVNEKQIADEGNNLKRRRELLQETERILDDSFSKQIEVLQGFTDQTIDANDLINTSDAVLLNEKVRRLNLDEILQNRLLEIIRERRAAQQDLVDSNRDLQESEREGFANAATIETQVALLEKLRERGTNLQKAFREFEEQTRKDQIENLRFQLSEAERGSAKFLEIQRDLNEALIEQDRIRLEEQEKQREQFREASFEALTAFFEKRFKASSQAIEREIQASVDRENELRALAQRGAEDAADNLAFEQRRRAELERQREEQARRQARIELALAAVQTFSEKTAAGDPNPLVSTITDVTLLRQFVASLPGFFEGTENVGRALGAPDLAGRDGYVVRLDGSERVLNGSENALVGNMSNTDLALLAFTARTERKKTADPSSELLQAVEGVTKAVQGQPVYIGMDYHARTKHAVDIIKRGNRIERKARRASIIH